MEYRNREFAFRYREFLEDRVYEDLKVTLEKDDDRTIGVLRTIISGLVNMFLISLATHTVSIEDSNLLSHGIINVGLRSVLRSNFGINFGFISMNVESHNGR